MKQIILASGSPRRKELMKHLNLTYQIDIPQSEEVIDNSLPLKKRIEKLAYDKAHEIYLKNKDAIVIGADTVLEFEGDVLGKPHTKENAFKMLKRLQNKTHSVLTSVCIMSKDKTITFTSTSEVTFHPMSDDEITYYVNTLEPLDKAGAYTIQDKGAIYIKSIKGDFYAVMGLPISKVYQVLKNGRCEVSWGQ